MFEFTSEQLMLWVGSIIWPFVRISAVLLSAPLFGARTTNVRTRLALGFLLAIMLSPQLPEQPSIDPISLNGLTVAIQQVVIGLAMGFLVQMVFSAATQAGEGVALSMGLGFASVVDPSGGIQVPVVSQYFLILTTLIFLAFNGHLVLIQLLALSFRTFPIGETGLSTDSVWAVLNFATTMFGGAILIALPAVASLLLVNLSMGIAARAAPQLNIFAVGFPVTLTMGFILMVTLILPALPARIEELLNDAFGLLQMIIGVT